MAGGADGKKLAGKYNDFVNPRMEVMAEGHKISVGEECMLQSAEILSTLAADPDMAVLVYLTGTKQGSRDLEERIDPGAKMEILAGYDGELSRIFLGYLHEVQVTDRGQNLREYTLICLDVLGIMKKNNSFRTSGAKKIRQVLDEILHENAYGRLIEKYTVDAPPENLNRDCVLRGETHYDILCRLADELGFEFFCDRGELLFRKPPKTAGERYGLSREYGLLQVRLSATLAGQTGSIRIVGYNRRDEKIAGEAKRPRVTAPFWKKTDSRLADCGYVLRDPEIETGAQADHRARTLMERTAEQCLRMDAIHIGIPELRPGVSVSFEEETDSSLRGVVYVDRTVHLLDEGGYRTAVWGRRTTGGG
ncbi:MAG: contractile injection system protein, VgrG/Pvc8 family [Clostridium sp.]|nr:contractile injection system protein, VgrG/Pvc8 family [Acetatifactor muris]MCM1527173.1 contractile injection system protein, VgrG/Pvc8 family [Bacteroides sp.]MCM1562502.1 contractile injection system protein, VgrG/Pvc8 family [Clostridium sp.]